MEAYGLNIETSSDCSFKERLILKDIHSNIIGDNWFMELFFMRIDTKELENLLQYFPKIRRIVIKHI